MDWTFIFSFVGGSAALFAAIAWLARSLIGHWLTKAVEQYKSQLKFEHDAALERIRSDLQVLAREREVQFSHLHVKRAEIIASLYQSIVEAHDAVEACLDAFKNDPDKRRFDLAKLAIERGDDLAEFVIRHKIYFTPSLATELEELYTCLIDTAVYYRDHCSALREGKTDTDFVGLLGEVFVDMEGALTSTEAEFRRLLGVERDAPKEANQSPQPTPVNRRG